MKRKLAVILAFLCMLAMLSGCASVVLPANTTAPQDRDNPKPRTTAAPETEPEQNTMTAEEVAMQFMEACIENDPERFSECVPPSALDEFLSSFHVDGEDHELQVTEIHTDGFASIPLSEEDKQEFYDKHDFSLEEARIVTVYAKYYDYSKSEESSAVREVRVIRSENRWYAIGWS